MKLKNNDVIIVMKKSLNPIPQYQLVDKNGNLLKRSKNIFTSWFYKFSDPNTKKMSPQNLTEFC